MRDNIFLSRAPSFRVMNSVMGEDQAGESALLERVRGGDEEAFGALYATYRGRLFSFLLRLSGRPALAEVL